MINHFIKSAILVCFLCPLTIALQAQAQNTFSGWSALFGTYKLNSRFSIYFDGQARSADQWKELQSYLLRPGLHCQVSKNKIATIGYAYIGHHRRVSDISGWVPEHRIWEQFIINQSFAIGGHASSLQHRFRLEQRFIGRGIVKNNRLATDGHNFTQRLRYFARSLFPLKKTAAFKTGTFISLQNEIFVNVQHASVVNDRFFDQNRAYTSFGYRASPRFDIEIGYMNQFIAGKSNNTMNNILQLAGYLRL